MLARTGIIGLLVYIYMRPHEFIPGLANIQFLYYFMGMAIVGLILELSTGKLRIVQSVQRNEILYFYGWIMFSILANRPDTLLTNGITITVSVSLYAVCSLGIQNIRSLLTTALTIFGLGLFVATVGAHQGMQPFSCMIGDPKNPDAKPHPDGRACDVVMGEGEDAIDGNTFCIAGGEPGQRYACEKSGLLGTMSIGGGRVRYLGVLEDPNELGLATSMCVPFAFAFFEQRKNTLRIALLVATVGIVGLTNYFTASRGGQLVFAAVLGAYFIKRFGVTKGLIGAMALVLPLMLLGGREGSEADESAQERLEAAAEGIKMAITHPVVGVGYAQFTEHFHLTAHNAYILALGELGFTGMVMFSTILYVSIKIPVMVMRHEFYDPEGEIAKSLAMALLATFTGVVIGIFFLSWTYHYVLWIHFGLSGALYSVVRAKDRRFTVTVDIRERAALAGLCLAMILALFVKCKQKGAW